MTLNELNTDDRDAFVGALGWIVEESPWVAERAWARRPFATVDALHQALTAAIDDAGRDEQLAILRAHPDLGARVRMSPVSTSEQSGAGLTALSPAQRTRLLALTSAYRERFGFPFLFAVKGSTTEGIIAALETRLTGSLESEFAEALRQVHRIAWLRIVGTIGGL